MSSSVGRTLRLTDEDGRLQALRRYDVLDTQPEAEFDKITNLVKSIFNVQFAAVSLVDAERQWFKSIRGLQVSETPRSAAFCNHTIRGRNCLVVPDATLDRRFCDSPLVTAAPFIRSYAGAPLQTPDGYNVGALCVFDVQPREFAPEHLALLENFAALVVGELELRQIASRDALTGLLTRRAFSAALDHVFAQYSRDGGQASLAVFDLDHFKAVNDRYGHPVGDAVLRAVADSCVAAHEQTDILGRLGGEEFGILMVGLGGKAALAKADRLRQTIAAARAPEWETVRVTASFGVADLDHQIQSPAQWMAVADAALYRAKAAGRNVVCN